MELWVELPIATDDDWDKFLDHHNHDSALVLDAKGLAWHVFVTDEYIEQLYALRPGTEDEDEPVGGLVEDDIIPLPAVAIIKPDRRLLRLRKGKPKLKEQSEAATGNRTEAPGTTG